VPAGYYDAQWNLTAKHLAAAKVELVSEEDGFTVLVLDARTSNLCAVVVDGILSDARIQLPTPGGVDGMAALEIYQPKITHVARSSPTQVGGYRLMWSEGRLEATPSTRVTVKGRAWLLATVVAAIGGLLILGLYLRMRFNRSLDRD
jgi:hypothetical protein